MCNIEKTGDSWFDIQTSEKLGSERSPLEDIEGGVMLC